MKSAQEIADAAKARFREIMKLFLLVIASTLAAQTIDIRSLYQPAPLTGVWKQNIGDDKRFADLNFDDSGWTQVTMPRPSIPGPRGILS